jgi:hypothetical protein
LAADADRLGKGTQLAALRHVIFRRSASGTSSALHHGQPVRAFPPPTGGPNQRRFDGAIASNFMRVRPMMAADPRDKGVQKSIVGIRRSYFWRPLFLAFR